jgi:hypothetical protein
MPCSELFLTFVRRVRSSRRVHAGKYSPRGNSNRVIVWEAAPADWRKMQRQSAGGLSSRGAEVGRDSNPSGMEGPAGSLGAT